MPDTLDLTSVPTDEPVVSEVVEDVEPVDEEVDETVEPVASASEAEAEAEAVVHQPQPEPEPEPVSTQEVVQNVQEILSSTETNVTVDNSELEERVKFLEERLENMVNILHKFRLNCPSILQEIK